MSEVDRLSNSGLYPALAPGDHPRKDGHPRQPQPRPDAAADKGDSTATSQTQRPRPPKSLIDEYA